MNLKDINTKHARQFGYLFSFIFFGLSIYFYFKNNIAFSFFVFSSLSLSILTFKYPKYLRYPAFFWQRLGIVLGYLISPVVLLLIYLLTVLPINLIIRVLRKDILDKKIHKDYDSYWKNIEKKKIDFNIQF